MRIQTLEIAGLGPALMAMRLPYNSKEKSDSRIPYRGYVIEKTFHAITDTYDYQFHTCPDSTIFISIGAKDLSLLSKLITSGDEHGKAARGIIVWADITAPRYWWQEMDTYRIGTDCLSSESTMHNEGKGLSGAELQKVKAAIKEGTTQTRIRTFSYQCLRRIYQQRRKHRLPEWQEFCGWIESLPLSKELIMVEKV